MTCTLLLGRAAAHALVHLRASGRCGALGGGRWARGTRTMAQLHSTAAEVHGEWTKPSVRLQAPTRAATRQAVLRPVVPAPVPAAAAKHLCPHCGYPTALAVRATRRPLSHALQLPERGRPLWTVISARVNTRMHAHLLMISSWAFGGSSEGGSSWNGRTQGARGATSASKGLAAPDQAGVATPSHRLKLYTTLWSPIVGASCPPLTCNKRPEVSPTEEHRLGRSSCAGMNLAVATLHGAWTGQKTSLCEAHA